MTVERLIYCQGWNAAVKAAEDAAGALNRRHGGKADHRLLMLTVAALPDNAGHTDHYYKGWSGGMSAARRRAQSMADMVRRKNMTVAAQQATTTVFLKTLFKIKIPGVKP